MLDRRERVVHVEDSLSDVRRNFFKLHEVGHDILPWQHELKVVAETGKTLSSQTERLFEREANQCAAELYFQAGLFQRISHDYPVNITTPIQLAELLGASRKGDISSLGGGGGDAAHRHIVCRRMRNMEREKRETWLRSRN